MSEFNYDEVKFEYIEEWRLEVRAVYTYKGHSFTYSEYGNEPTLNLPEELEEYRAKLLDGHKYVPSYYIIEWGQKRLLHWVMENRSEQWEQFKTEYEALRKLEN